ncbi:hypothetical protein Tco_1197459 [Tanacetum coccineum]
MCNYYRTGMIQAQSFEVERSLILSKMMIVCLVVAATSYFIWQERNGRLFKNSKRTVNLVVLRQLEIYMLVEKKYPLAPLTLSQMLEKKLMIDYESEMAYQLLKFIIKQLKK